MARRVVYSRFKAEDVVVLRKDYGKYPKWHRFVVEDPRKNGDLKIKVKDPNTAASEDIETKYLSLLK